jgi:hypothetical protein
VPGRAVRRYHRLEGVSISGASPLAVQVKVHGEWHWIPRTVLHAPVKREGAENDEVTVDEWYAKRRGWM